MKSDTVLLFTNRGEIKETLTLLKKDFKIDQQVRSVTGVFEFLREIDIIFFFFYRDHI